MRKARCVRISVHVCMKAAAYRIYRSSDGSILKGVLRLRDSLWKTAAPGLVTASENPRNGRCEASDLLDGLVETDRNVRISLFSSRAPSNSFA